MLFDAHWHGFRVFGGVPERGISDNMKTAVDRMRRLCPIDFAHSWLGWSLPPVR
jgi:transposase